MSPLPFTLLLLAASLAASPSRAESPLPARDVAILRGPEPARGHPLDAHARGSSAAGAAPNLYFGYTRETALVEVGVRNESDRAEWVLAIKPPILDRVELEVLDREGKVSQTRTFLSHEAPPGAAGARFPIELPRGEESLLRLRIESTHKMNIGLRLLSRETALREERSETLFVGLYFGGLLSLILYNAVLFIGLRERLTLTLMVFSSAVGAMVFTLQGHADQLFSGIFGAIPFSRYLCTLSATATLLSLVFTRTFLGTRRERPRLDVLLRAAAAGALAIALLSVTPIYDRWSELLGYSVDAVILSSVTLILATGIRSALAGNVQARFFLLSWTGLLAAVALYFGWAYGLFPDSPIIEHSIPLGSLLQMLMLSFAVSHRVRHAETHASALGARSSLLRNVLRSTYHDLANPMSVVLTRAEVNARRDSDWAPIARAAREQKALLDYLRALDTEETGQSLPVPLPMPLAFVQAIETARLIFEDRLREKELQLDARESPGIPSRCAALAQPIALSHVVINNILSNAIKFSPYRGTITVALEPVPGEPERLDLLFSDQGAGIPPEKARAILDGATIASGAGTSGETGSGRGLSLAINAVRSWGGEVTFEPRPEGGTAVRVRLRLRPESPA